MSDLIWGSDVASDEPSFDIEEGGHDGHDGHDHSNCDHDHHDDEPELTEAEIDAERKELVTSFQSLSSDVDALIRSIKPTDIVRDIRRVEPRLFQRYFRGYRPNKIGRGKMVTVLKPAIMEEGNIAVIQLLSLMWNRRNDKIYKSMRALVQTINEDVEAIELIEDDKATEFVASLNEKGFERSQVHICVRVNGVRFSEEFIKANLCPTDA
jgi:hypothetical protein